MVSDDFVGKVGFVVGTGRCGTFLAHRLLALEPGIASYHERHRLLECFHRYCQWYGLDVDSAGFIGAKSEGIQRDLQGHRFSFEASGFLSHSIKELHAAFDARFVLFVRNPIRVINSYLSSSWYVQEVRWERPESAPGYQSGYGRTHHFFSRIMPKGNEFERFRSMGRVGKLAWHWSQVNLDILRQLEALPESSTMVLRIEDFDFSTYQKMLDVFCLESSLTKDTFRQITSSKPNKHGKQISSGDWSTDDVAQFDDMIAEAAEAFGYPTSYADYPAEEPTGRTTDPARPKKKPGRRFRRALRRSVRAFVEELARTPASNH